MSKKENDTPKQSPEEVLMQNRFKEMVSQFEKHFKRDDVDEPLITNPTDHEYVKHMSVDWQLPPEANLRSHSKDFDDTEEMEIDINAEGNTYININEKEQVIKDETYALGRTLVMIKPTASAKPDFFYMTDQSRDNFVLLITAGSVGTNPPRAFLTAGCEDGKTYYFEPEEFCVLSVTDEIMDREEGIFTLFIKKTGFLSVKFFSNFPKSGTTKMSAKTFPSPPIHKIPRDLTDNDERMIRDRFNDSLKWYAKSIKLTAAQNSKTIPIDTPESSPFNSLRLDKQSMSQEKMRDFCRLIRRRGARNKGDDRYVEFSFKDLKLNADSYFFPSHSLVEVTFKPTGDSVYNFSLRKDNGLDAVIIGGQVNGSGIAFLVVKRDGKEYIFELEWFSLLNIRYKTKKEDLGIFIMYNNSPNVLFFSFYTTQPDKILHSLDVYGSKATKATTKDGDDTNDPEEKE